MRVTKISCHATDSKIGNAGHKLHWRLCLWEKSGFPALSHEGYYLAVNKALRPVTGIFGLKENLFSLTVCTLDQYLKNGSEKFVSLP